MGTPKPFLLGLLLLVLWASFGEAASLKYKDPKQPIGVRIRDLVERMTLAEKIGQMTQLDRTVATPQIMKDYFIGSHLCAASIDFILFFSYISSFNQFFC